MGETNGRWTNVGWCLLCAAAVVLVWWVTAGEAKVGDKASLAGVVGFPIAVLSAVLGAASLVYGRRATLLAEGEPLRLLRELADAVEQTERRQWKDLLAGDDASVDVRFVFHPAGPRDATGAGPDGTLIEVASYYKALTPRRLVITGAPGAGKTVLAVRLLLAILGERTPDRPVPVRLPLASWDTRIPLETWVTGHLTATYRVRPEAARRLVAARHVLPVLDGLDEMDSDATTLGARARAAIEALNDYQQRETKAPIILTCRADRYAALSTFGDRVLDAARVEIRPVTVAQARDFLTRRVRDIGRWRTVLTHLETSPSSALSRAMSTPWRLTLAVTAYEERDHHAYLREPRNLLAPTLNTSEAVRDHLLALFIPAATRGVDGRRARSTPEQTHTRLAVLAAYLDENTTSARVVEGRTLSGTELVLHELWPLAGGSRVPRYANRLIKGVGLVATATGGLAVSAVSSITNAAVLCGLLIVLLVGVPDIAWPVPEQPVVLRRRHSGSWTDDVRTGTLWAIAFGLGSATFSGLMATPTLGMPVGPAVGVIIGLGFAIVVGLGRGLAASGTTGATHPHQVIARDAKVRISRALAFAPSFGLVVFLSFAPGFGREAASVQAVTVVIVLGMTSLGPMLALRYGVLLWCARGRLPRRLGAFLDEATDIGLLRVTGIAYQFRHRELQDWLARNPTP
ncbi:NACHT domain-containing protein [Embleya sp. NPDC059237]|uniref:NACHT domain-containing protein n=1 Tax=Embleya sp. NPDC059237 TaxID=3346784 RepID=UPI0036C76320